MLADPIHGASHAIAHPVPTAAHLSRRRSVDADRPNPDALLDVSHAAAARCRSPTDPGPDHRATRCRSVSTALSVARTLVANRHASWRSFDVAKKNLARVAIRPSSVQRIDGQQTSRR